MKVILSRKGFDQSRGGGPSPVFPDGTMYSLPISGIGSSKSYKQVGCPAGNLGKFVESLEWSLTRGAQPVHLDPDLDAASIPRLAGWRPAFGQAGRAQSHLENQAVGPGDVFLFYGWFRQVEQGTDKKWRSPRGTRNLHAVFGWLQIAEVIDVDQFGVEAIIRDRPWLRDHPHLHVPANEVWGRNVIYVAAERLRLPGLRATALSGAGVNRCLHDDAILTAPDHKCRSHWRLPAWFLDHEGRMALSCNPNPKKCQRAGDHVILQSVRPQEQVLDCASRPQVARWIQSLIGH